MLCQLVCVDRRYQRMNCFNIRELQGILKRKFFPDLVNINDHRNLMETSMLGLRFKINNNDSIRPEQSLFYNFGLTNTSKQKNINFTNYIYQLPTNNIENYKLNLNLINSILQYRNLLSTNSKFFESYTPIVLIEIISLITNVTVFSYVNIQNALYYLLPSFIQNINIINFYILLPQSS